MSNSHIRFSHNRLLLAHLCIVLAVSMVGRANGEVADPLNRYNVVWDSPSKDHNGSIPIGNGDIGANAWMEPGGDLVLLLSKTDAWSENCRLLKLGRVRVKLSPNPLAEGVPFKQTLRLRQGDILIEMGEGQKAVALRLWIDANRPVVCVEVDSPSQFDVQATLEVWRTKKRQLTGKEIHSAYGLQGAPFPAYVYPDTVVDDRKNQIVWYHRNETSIYDNNLKHQGMEGFLAKSPDPLLHRTFGGCIEGQGLVSENPTTLRSAKPQRRFVLSIYPLCSQTDSIAPWLKQLDKTVVDNSLKHLDTDRTAHRAWWNDFWNRSWIRVTGPPETETVTRGYTLQRWITACAGRGVHPIKFNGTIFTVDGGGFDADYRLWGGPYWWQNTRLPYWPMLASGDFDMMIPMFRLYQDMLPLAEFRTKTWFNHEGAFIGETIYFWGMYNNGNYGWKRGKDLPVGELTNRFIRREYTASLELMAMMLDYYAFTGNEKFLRERLLPMCDSLLKFWGEHYKTAENGRMKIYPAQALETLQDAEKPTPDIAGLQWVLAKLLALSEDKVGPQRRKFWTQLSKKVPPLPMAGAEGKKYVLGAGKVFGGSGNSENPALYAVFPFRLYGVGKPGLDIGRLTFDRRKVKGNNGWRQDDTQAAFLGLAKTAADYIAGRAANKNRGSRFPAFWGPNMDWTPDQDHGGNLTMGLQTMILQADDGKIRLLPAWPKNWDLEFKLHAPQNTTVEGTVQGGKIENLKVTPESRRKDVVTLPPQ